MNTLSPNASHDVLNGELVSPAQAALYLSVAKNTVYHWLRMGYFPHYRAGKLIRIRLRDLETFLRSESTTAAVHRT